MTTFVKKVMLQGYKAHPRVECMVEMVVDWERLAVQLGEKAYRNKSKRSVDIGGLVKVTVRPTQAEKAKADPTLSLRSLMRQCPELRRQRPLPR